MRRLLTSDLLQGFILTTTRRSFLVHRYTVVSHAFNAASRYSQRNSAFALDLILISQNAVTSLHLDRNLDPLMIFVDFIKGEAGQYLLVVSN